MRRFHIVAHPVEEVIEGVVFLDSVEWGGFFYPDLMKGDLIGSLPSGLRFYITETCVAAENVSVIICPFGWKVVATNVADSLMQCFGGNVEMLAVPVFDCFKNPVSRKFFAINALNNLDALSEKKTVFSPIAIGSARPVLNPWINSSKVPADVHIFRTVGDVSRLYVDNVGKNALSGCAGKGMVFLPVGAD
jgi:hypothetical protein